MQRISISAMVYVILLGVVAVIAFLGLYKLKTSSKWAKTQGEILVSNFERIYTGAIQQDATADSSLTYSIQMKYRYSVQGKEFLSTCVMPGMPNVVRNRKTAEDVVRRFPAGKHVDVFYNLQSPEESALITGKDVPYAAIIVLLVLIALAGGIIFVGIRFVMNN